MVVVAHLVALVAHEHRKPQPEGVERRQERRHHAQERQRVEQHRLVLHRVGQRIAQDQVFGEEARGQRHARQRQAAGKHQPAGDGHLVPHAAHLADVQLPGQGVHHAAGGQEQQRLEKRVGHQVKHRPVGAQAAHAQEHVAQLRNRRVSKHALQVVAGQRDGGGKQRRDRADSRHGRQRVGRELKQRQAAGDQVHPRGHHRRRVHQGRHRRGPGHRVGQPHIQRQLGRLAEGSDHQQERDPQVGRRHHAVAVRHGRQRFTGHVEHRADL